jgi:hypothetical protein
LSGDLNPSRFKSGIAGKQLLLFDFHFTARWIGVHVPDMLAKPFFLVGCGRSGTSLLRSMLNNHSRIAIPTESLFMVDYLRVQDRFALEDLVDLIIDEPEITEWGLNVEKVDLSDCETVPEVLKRLHNLYASSKHADVWGQKTPRFVRHMQTLGSAFPDAVFIHIVRDPRAVVNSLTHSDVHRSNPYHGTRRWCMDVEAGLAYEVSSPARVHRVSYEELVREPKQTLENILEFIGLPYETGMLDHQSDLDEYSAFYENIHKNLTQEINPGHINKWEHSLTPLQVSIIESIAEDLMFKLGYPIRYPGSSVSGWYRIRMHVRRTIDLLFQVSKYLRQRRAYFGYLIKRKKRLGLMKEFMQTINY